MSAPVSAALLKASIPGLQLPAYDRRRVRPGIVHLGAGAFHRAHQAAYVDDLLAHDPRWGITGVSLRSPDVQAALSPQSCLYTLLLKGPETRARLIGSIGEILLATRQGADVIEQIAAPTTGLITLTITEKGYCLDESGQLNFEHPEIAHDIANPQAPCSALGYLVAGLAARRISGTPPPVIMSCDNLPQNSLKLAAAIVALAAQTDRELSRWIASEVRFPCTMVDSITPATGSRLRQEVLDRFGIVDAWPIEREPFTAWVIEDLAGTNLPDFASVGAILTTDIAGHSAAKLRLLNGAHSALAYFGLALGETTVAGAMENPLAARYLSRLLVEELAPSVRAPAAFDVSAYCETVLERFRNPAIEYRLPQICGDSSQKIPARLLPALTENLAAGRPITRIATALAGWILQVRRLTEAGTRLADPQGTSLAALARAANGDAEHDSKLFLERSGLFAEPLISQPCLRKAIAAGYRHLIHQQQAALRVRSSENAA